MINCGCWYTTSAMCFTNQAFMSLKFGLNAIEFMAFSFLEYGRPEKRCIKACIHSFTAQTNPKPKPEVLNPQP